MDKMWAVQSKAMTTVCMKEFTALLGIKTRDMQGGMRVFTKLTKAAGISADKMATILRLPSGSNAHEGGQASPLLMHFFNAAVSSSAGGASQGLTYRSFMFFHATFQHAPLANPEKARFWYNVMKLSNDSECDLTESTPTSVACRFLRDVLCSKSSGLDAYIKSAPSKVLARVTNTLSSMGLQHETHLDFPAFLALCTACSAAPVMFDFLDRLQAAFHATPLAADPYLQLKLRCDSRGLVQIYVLYLLY